MEEQPNSANVVASAVPIMNKLHEIQRHDQLMQLYERQKKAKTLINVPGNEKEAKFQLRVLKQPITLFGEDIDARKERLRSVVTKIYLETGSLPKFPVLSRDYKAKEDKDDHQLFYTEGLHDLKQARIKIALYSLPQSTMRLESTRKKRIDTDRVKEAEEYEHYISLYSAYTLKRTLYADDRRISYSSLSPNQKYIATSGWSGESKIWSVPNGDLVSKMIGHSDKVTYIAFHPYSGLSLSEYGPNIATSSVDMGIRLWTLDPSSQAQPSIEFKGHEDRINCVEFHPSGSFLGSSCHDCSWKLWDLEKKLCVLTQGGHIAPVRPLCFQGDGSLVATGDTHGIGLIWDLRTGKEILSLQGHAGQLISLKFLPNGYQISSSSDDNTIKIWDLRKKCCIYTIPAHTGAVTDIKFEKEGKLMLSCSYDNTGKIWTTNEWQPVCELKGLNSQVSSINITNDTNTIMTTTVDKKLCFWERAPDARTDVQMNDINKI